MTDKHDDYQDCANENTSTADCPRYQFTGRDLYVAKEAAPKTKVDRHKELCQLLNGIYARKNADYGDSFGKTFEEEGFAMSRIRLSDKLNRFKTLSRGAEQKVNDESIRDTLMDLANYALMTVLEMDIRKGE